MTILEPSEDDSARHPVDESGKVYGGGGSVGVTKPLQLPGPRIPEGGGGTVNGQPIIVTTQATQPPAAGLPWAWIIGGAAVLWFLSKK